MTKKKVQKNQKKKNPNSDLTFFCTLFLLTPKSKL